jgi:hypothetical protein
MESNDPKPKKVSDLEKISVLMNQFLILEMLEDIPCPEHLQKSYDDLDKTEKKEWFEYTSQEVFKEAVFLTTGCLGRNLEIVEFNLIKRRIINFLNQNIRNNQ